MISIETRRSALWVVLAAASAIACDPMGPGECLGSPCPTGQLCVSGLCGAMPIDEPDMQPEIEPDGCMPAEERCNGVDDDCDGVADEAHPELGTACSVGVGLCARSGVVVCTEDGTTGCGVSAGNSEAEQCNGLDDDCDGETDEGLGVGDACTAGEGICARNGVNVCGPDGQITCRADVGEGSAELCNGVDDDCDGRTDEDFADLGDACADGLGRCLRAGSVVCTENSLGTECDARPGEPAQETCNRADDDCDGSVDEIFVDLDEACVLGIGACAAAGVRTCTETGLATECNAEVGETTEERCNGQDDDCDGSTDETFPTLGAECRVGQGTCAAVGVLVCNADEHDAVCNVQPGAGTPEVCNGLDDDCDGETDEDPQDVGAACATGVGACRSAGRVACLGGERTCDAVAGEPEPDDLTCDGVDDDCDGVEDESAAVAGCGVGECAREGRCAGGEPRCEPAQRAPNDALCNGLDDDCDGLVDEGSLGECGLGPALCPDLGQLVCAEAGVVCEALPVNLECRSLSLDGPPQAYVQVPAQPRFELTTFTLEAIIRVREFADPQMSIVAHGESEGDEGPTTDKTQYDLRFGPPRESGAQLQLAWERTDEPLRDRVESLVSHTELTTGRWYHVAATRDEAGHARLYIDGQLDRATDEPLPPPPAIIDHPLLIGARWNNNGNVRFVDSVFEGEIEDVRIWNRALDAEDFAPCRATAPDVSSDALVAWFRASDDDAPGMIELKTGVHYPAVGPAAVAEGADACGSSCAGLDEACNGLDDDCDGRIDEALPAQDRCDGRDDNCDGIYSVLYLEQPEFEGDGLITEIGSQTRISSQMNGGAAGRRGDELLFVGGTNCGGGRHVQLFGFEGDVEGRPVGLESQCYAMPNNHLYAHMATGPGVMIGANNNAPDTVTFGLVTDADQYQPLVEGLPGRMKMGASAGRFAVALSTGQALSLVEYDGDGAELSDRPLADGDFGVQDVVWSDRSWWVAAHLEDAPWTLSIIQVPDDAPARTFELAQVPCGEAAFDGSIAIRMAPYPGGVQFAIDGDRRQIKWGRIADDEVRIRHLATSAAEANHHKALIPTAVGTYVVQQFEGRLNAYRVDADGVLLEAPIEIAGAVHTGRGSIMGPEGRIWTFYAGNGSTYTRRLIPPEPPGEPAP